MTKKYSSMKKVNEIVNQLNSAFDPSWTEDDIYNHLISLTSNSLIVDEIMSFFNGDMEELNTNVNSGNKARRRRRTSKI